MVQGSLELGFRTPVWMALECPELGFALEFESPEQESLALGFAIQELHTLASKSSLAPGLVPRWLVLVLVQP